MFVCHHHQQEILKNKLIQSIISKRYVNEQINKINEEKLKGRVKYIENFKSQRNNIIRYLFNKEIRICQ